jgi:hypothetical protein
MQVPQGEQAGQDDARGDALLGHVPAGALQLFI